MQYITEDEYSVLKSLTIKTADAYNNLSIKNPYLYGVHYFAIFIGITLMYFIQPYIQEEKFYEILFYVFGFFSLGVIFLTFRMLKNYKKGIEMYISIINTIENEEISKVFKKIQNSKKFEYISFQNFDINGYKDLNCVKLLLDNFITALSIVNENENNHE